MLFFPMPDSTQLSSILLGSLSLIPNDGLRYAALASAVAFLLLFHLRLKPAGLLHQLAERIKHSEDLFEQAKLNCAPSRDPFRVSLAAEWIRLLEVKRTASDIQCRLWAEERPTWKQYWHINRRIAKHITTVDNISTTIQLVLAAELQRKIAQEIDENRSILQGNARSICAVCGIPAQTSSPAQYICGYSAGSQV
ncbi:hypothetical protein DFH06DRAFT_1237715 [Mycena polygramma]|nr:hypothetical protein DFH06DRAFT_1237715 [Mycena polygramma]